MGATGWWAEILSFSVATTVQKVRASFAGVRADPTGTAQPAMRRMTAALTGVMQPKGSIASDAQTPMFAAAQITEAVGESTLRPLTAALVATQKQQGTEAATLQKLTASLAGTQKQSGTMAASVAKVVSALAGTAAAPLQFINATSTTGTAMASMPTHAAGDLLIMYAWRDGSVTRPTVPTGSGWQDIASSTTVGSTCCHAMGAKIATSSSEASGTWSGATALVCISYRNAVAGGVTGGLGSGSTITYPAATRASQQPNESWITRFAGHRTATNLTTNTPAGYTSRAGIASETRVIDSNGAVAADPSAATQSVNASSGWLAITMELASYAAAPNFSDTFSSGTTPDATKWTFGSFSGGSSATVGSGVLTIATGGAEGFGSLFSTTEHDGTGTIMKWQVTAKPTTGDQLFNFLMGSTLGFGWAFSWTGSSSLAYVVGDPAFTAHTITNNEWYRIRESGGTLYGEWSSNNSTWTTHYSSVSTATILAFRRSPIAIYWSGNTASSMSIDNFTWA